MMFIVTTIQIKTLHGLYFPEHLQSSVHVTQLLNYTVTKTSFAPTFGAPMFINAQSLCGLWSSHPYDFEFFRPTPILHTK